MRQALLVSNLAARTVSRRLKQVIVKALSADLKLEVADTESRNHATELARDAADRGFDLVIAFGGDGTMNEVANGLVGSDTALALLPGGMVNVMCRTLGIPTDIVEATGYLLNRIQSWRTERINVGRMDGRHFVMSCGVGLDAATIKRVEANPSRKRTLGEWYFMYAAIREALGEFRGRDPDIRLAAGEVNDDVVLGIVCNIPQLTFFKGWPVKVTPHASLEGGLDVIGLRRLPLRYVLPLFWTTMKTGGHLDWKHVVYAHDVDRVDLTHLSDSSVVGGFPTQVDGEYIGEATSLNIRLMRDGLPILV